jgi:hypothetical protein
MYICPLLLFCVIGGRLKNLKFLDLTFLLTVVYQLSEKKKTTPQALLSVLYVLYQ